MLVLYYEGVYDCNEHSCKTKTRQITVKNKCVVSKCKGKVVPEYSEAQTNDTMRYLQGLFNIEKYFIENKMTSGEHPHWREYNRVKEVVDQVLDRSKYNKVHLGDLFSFMKK